MRLFDKIFRKKAAEPENPAIPSKLSKEELGYIAAEIGQLQAIIAFMEGNEALVKKHGMHSPITWDEVEKLQLTAKHQYEKLEKIKDSLGEKVPNNRDDNLYRDTKEKQGFNKLQERVSELSHRSEKINWQISDNFKKFHDKSHEERTDLSPATNTKKELVLDLLSKNKGLAIGEIHTEEEAPKMIKELMADFKKSGVDTLYLEMNNSNFSALQKMSYQQLIDYSKGKEIVIDNTSHKKSTVKEQSLHFGTASDDSSKQIALMFAEAKKNGIEIVNMDKRHVTDFDNDGKTRISHTNLEWTEAIQQDRAQNHKTGKFIVLGGFNHLIGMGAVDEALGIPSIGFNKSVNPFGFYKAEKDSGLDYILRGSIDHYEYGKVRDIRPADLPLPPASSRQR